MEAPIVVEVPIVSVTDQRWGADRPHAVVTKCQSTSRPSTGICQVLTLRHQSVAASVSRPPWSRVVHELG